MEARAEALKVLCVAEPVLKARLARELLDAARAGLPVDTATILSPLPTLPGRPLRPRLVPPGEVPRRTPFTPEGRAALLHAVCHIEFNAINLALDSVWRFAGMPERYYLDWLQVAGEEALHFGLLREHLRHLGHDYGDFEAHDGLWTMAEKTGDDITARMALVPRTLEARGLDATPLIQRKLRAVATPDALAACDILDLILREEIGHVAIGNHWYRWLCARQGLEPLAHYRRLTRHHRAPRLRGPFNTEARRQAGFSDDELRALSADPPTPS